MRQDELKGTISGRRETYGTGSGAGGLEGDE